MTAYRIVPFLALVLFLLQSISSCTEAQEQAIEEEEKLPNSWFFMQRAYPLGFIPKEAYQRAWKQAATFRQSQDFQKQTSPWEFAGPVNVGGRITDLEMPVNDMQTIYAGAASGGIFKSTDQGLSWTPIFDEAASLSIGDMALAPSDPNILYVGTGEANAGGGSLAYDGLGVYKSTDAGQSWQHIGLEAVGSIGRVAVDPQNPDKVFAATMGDLFGNNPERGLYRTEDGGTSWQQVLFLNDSTGAIDVIFHPQNPDVVYAATWERVRRPHRRSYGGPGSGIFKSMDGGDTWTRVRNNGWPNNDLGRIGLTISPSDPDILYAVVSNQVSSHQGFFKSTDGGGTWSFTGNDGFGGASFMYWFGKIFIHPANPSKVYAASLDMHASANDGQNWNSITTGQAHVDQHAMIVHPMDTSFFIIGNDGGIYISKNEGASWQHLDNLPITQFYTCEIDYTDPDHLLGGTQDNGTIRTRTGSTGDWGRIYGGDGFVVRVDPTNNNYVYAESQYGSIGRSETGGNGFRSARTGIDFGQRRNWKTPYVLDPLHPSTLYYGAQTVYKSEDRAQTWRPISPDLTNGPGDNLVFGTISALAVSPVNNTIIYAGTDDGNVWVTTDSGTNWDKVSANLPKRWVTAIEADPFDAGTVYLTFSGYRFNAYQAHIFRSRDYGQSWEDIGASLPEAPANDIVPDPADPDRLYLATDFGVYETPDGGLNWTLLTEGLPNVPVVDLTFHQPTRTLVAATYGRSMYTLRTEELVHTQEALKYIAGMKVYPVPVQQHSIMEVEVLEKGEYYLESIDAGGKVLQQQKVNFQKGLQTVSLEGFLPKSQGVFILRLRKGNNSKAITLAKLD